MTFSNTTTKRFWNKVTRTDSCWLWNGSKNKIRGNYGRFNYSNKLWLAHRLSWVIHNGIDVPKGFVVMHICDNTPCVNPSHLRLGTQKDNVRDAFQKKRMVGSSGSKNGRSILLEKDIPKIRQLFNKKTLAQIARDFGISPTTIWEIKNGRKWSHI